MFQLKRCKKARKKQILIIEKKKSMFIMNMMITENILFFLFKVLHLGITLSIFMHMTFVIGFRFQDYF